MNALQASNRLDKLHRRASALARVAHYLGDEREWDDDVAELEEMQHHIDREIKHLTEKLVAVEL